MTFLDLFCGCGGFSLGMQRAGFKCLAAIDFNTEAIDTFKANFHKEILAICTDITRFPPQKLAAELNISNVDVIVGGPPCQGFSTARQRDGANHGARLKEDPRRHLYKEFLRYVEFFKPKVFVMENVLGIRSAAGGEYFTAVQKEARKLDYRVHGQIEDAWELGVPQKRRRQLFIGVRRDLPAYFLPELKLAPRAEPRVWLGAAIGDLPALKAGGGENECEYDLGRRLDHIKKYGDTALKYLCEVLEIDRAKKLSNHVARPHSERDLRDFARLKEGENSAVAMRDRGVKFEFPYDKSTFKDRYTRQSRWFPCSTIVAHLSKPDFVFRTRRVAVFVDGCFWHACPKHGTKPASNKPFWRKKFAANVARDKLVNRELRRRGWRVLRLWEHSLKAPDLVAARIQKVLGSGV